MSKGIFLLARCCYHKVRLRVWYTETTEAEIVCEVEQLLQTHAVTSTRRRPLPGGPATPAGVAFSFKSDSRTLVDELSAQLIQAGYEAF